MDFFKWWLDRKNNESEKELSERVKSMKPIDPLIQDPSNFSRAPLQTLPHLMIDNFGDTLMEYLKNSNEINNTSRLRCLEALRIAQSTNGFLSEENRGAAIISLLSDSEAMTVLRSVRWRSGIYCPRCGSKNIVKKSSSDDIYTYYCLDCEKKSGGENTADSIFTDLTNISFAKDIKSILRWVLICYLKMFCSVGKISKMLGMSLDETIKLLSEMSQNQDFLKKKKKKDGF